MIPPSYFIISARQGLQATCATTMAKNGATRIGAHGNDEFNKTTAFEAQGDYVSGGVENVISNTSTKKNKLSRL